MNQTSLASIESASFFLQMPEVSFRDQRANAVAIRSISTALKDGVANDFLDREEAGRIFKRYLGLTGIDSGKEEPREKRGMYNLDASLSEIFDKVTETSSKDGYTIYQFADTFK